MTRPVRCALTFFFAAFGCVADFEGDANVGSAAADDAASGGAVVAVGGKKSGAPAWVDEDDAGLKVNPLYLSYFLLWLDSRPSSSRLFSSSVLNLYVVFGGKEHSKCHDGRWPSLRLAHTYGVGIGSRHFQLPCRSTDGLLSVFLLFGL